MLSLDIFLDEKELIQKRCCILLIHVYSQQNVMCNFSSNQQKPWVLCDIIPAIFLLVDMERSFCSGNCSGRREWAVQGEQTNPFGSIWKPLPPITWFSICHPFIARKQKHTMKKKEKAPKCGTKLRPKEKTSISCLSMLSTDTPFMYISIHTWKPQKQQLDLAELHFWEEYSSSTQWMYAVYWKGKYLWWKAANIFSSLCLCGAANMIVLTKGVLVFDCQNQSRPILVTDLGVYLLFIYCWEMGQVLWCDHLSMADSMYKILHTFLEVQVQEQQPMLEMI